MILDNKKLLNLVAINPNPGKGEQPKGGTFYVSDKVGIKKFIEERNGRYNLYFCPNEPADKINRKLKESDIAYIHAVWADIDPDPTKDLVDERARLLDLAESLKDVLAFPPSLALDSGGGIQIFWFLVDKLDAKEHGALIKALNRGLADMFDGDNVQNLDRIMRLPNTYNIPDARKLKKGRTKNKSKTLYTTRRYTLDELESFITPIHAPLAKSSEDANTLDGLYMDEVNKITCVSDLSAPMQKRLEKLKDEEPVFKSLWDGIPMDSQTDDTRSGFDFAAAFYIKRSFRIPTEFGQILSCLPSGKGPDGELRGRDISRAYNNTNYKTAEEEFAEEVEKAKTDKSSNDDHINAMNKRFSYILVGGKGRFMANKLDEHGAVDLMDKQSFTDLIASERIKIKKVNAKGKAVSNSVPLSQYWIEHKDRLTYDRLAFNPGGAVPKNQFNIWQGFSVEPDSTAVCDLIVLHVLEVVCSGDVELFKWVMGWFAQIVQQPAKKLGTSLVLRGRKGTGKSKLSDIFAELIKRHVITSAASEHIFGRFNGHLDGKLLLVAEEAFWSGDRKAEGALKHMITSGTALIEYKGLPAITQNSYIRLLIISNHDWVVPASDDERRFSVIDVNDSRQRDYAYFDAIDKQMYEEKGLEAFLYYLQNFDLSKVNLREIPKTQALADQKISSWEPEIAWWHECLLEGKISLIDEDWPKEKSHKELLEAYQDWAQNMGIRKRVSTVSLSKKLKQACPQACRTVQTRVPDGRKRVIHLASLEECRLFFEKQKGVKV